MNPGFIYALCAFTIWGLFPLYFRLIPLVAPLELVMQRTLWSLLFLGLLLTGLKRWAWLKQVWAEPRKLPLYAFSAVLLAANWMVYVYAIQTHQVAEASLGYFINPLVSVLLSVLVLRERLGVVKWVAVALAATGAVWLTWKLGRLPWIALVLACSFGVYGLVRKTSNLGALEGLALETLLLAPIALPALLWWTVSHNGAWAQPDLTSAAWLVLSGPLSVFPLLFFAAAAGVCPWPRWAWFSTCRPASSCCWLSGSFTSRSAATVWWALPSSGRRWRWSAPTPSAKASGCQLLRLRHQNQRRCVSQGAPALQVSGSHGGHARVHPRAGAAGAAAGPLAPRSRS
jgi:chloramphenicol-sensitive protein RarD